jgi:hypothetical protein
MRKIRGESSGAQALDSHQHSPVAAVPQVSCGANFAQHARHRHRTLPDGQKQSGTQLVRSGFAVQIDLAATQCKHRANMVLVQEMPHFMRNGSRKLSVVQQINQPAGNETKMSPEGQLNAVGVSLSSTKTRIRDVIQFKRGIATRSTRCCRASASTPPFSMSHFRVGAGMPTLQPAPARAHIIRSAFQTVARMHSQ